MTGKHISLFVMLVSVNCVDVMLAVTEHSYLVYRLIFHKADEFFIFLLNYRNNFQMKNERSLLYVYTTLYRFEMLANIVMSRTSLLLTFPIQSLLYSSTLTK